MEHCFRCTFDWLVSYLPTLNSLKSEHLMHTTHQVFEIKHLVGVWNQTPKTHGFCYLNTHEHPILRLFFDKNSLKVEIWAVIIFFRNLQNLNIQILVGFKTQKSEHLVGMLKTVLSNLCLRNKQCDLAYYNACQWYNVQWVYRGTGLQVRIVLSCINYLPQLDQEAHTIVLLRHL